VVVDQSQLDAAMKKTDDYLGLLRGGQRVLQAFGAAAAAVAGNALVGFITQTVQAADDVGDLAARLGVTTDELQIMKAVADDVGTGVGAMQTAFKTLAHQMRESGKGAGKEFHELGVATRNADGSMRSVTDVFWDAGAALGSLEDQAQRQDLAQRLLGRSALDLLPIFAGGAEAVSKYREQIAETAVVFDAAFVEKSDEAAKQIQAFQNRLARVRALIVAELLPAFQWALSVFSKVVATVQKFVQSGRALQALLTGGTAAALRWASAFALNVKNLGSVMGWLFRIRGVLLAIGRMAKGFALFLIIDELITLFRGGDTLIGRFIDKLFGVGKAAAMVDLVRGAVSSLLDTLGLLFNSDGVEDWELAFIKASEGIANAFDAMFSGLWQVAKDFGEFFQLVIGQAVDWVVGKIKSIPGVETIMGALSAPQGGGFGPGVGSVVPAIAPPPALSAGAVAGATGASVNDSRHQEVNITVQGNATPETARRIGQEASKAVGTMGRDRAAIGASVGVGL
jgi:hypothetical protein